MSQYTVWVGGTEVTDNYVDFEDAKRLYDYYTKERGHNDVRVECESISFYKEIDNEHNG